MDYFKKANEFYLEKEYDEAIINYQKCLENNKISIYKIHYNIGVCYIKLENYTTALSYLTISNQIQSNYKTLYNISLCFYALSEYDQAIFYIKKCKEINNDDPDLIKLINKIEEKTCNKFITLQKKDYDIKSEFEVRKLTKKEKLEIILAKLEFLLNDSLDNNDKKLFDRTSKRYNKLKKILEECNIC